MAKDGSGHRALKVYQKWHKWALIGRLRTALNMKMKENKKNPCFTVTMTKLGITKCGNLYKISLNICTLNITAKIQ